jgi:hypothetical protein
MILEPYQACLQNLGYILYSHGRAVRSGNTKSQEFECCTKNIESILSGILTTLPLLTHHTPQRRYQNAHEGEAGSLRSCDNLPLSASLYDFLGIEVIF